MTPPFELLRAFLVHASPPMRAHDEVVLNVDLNGEHVRLVFTRDDLKPQREVTDALR